MAQSASFSLPRLWISLWHDSTNRWRARCHFERDDALEELDHDGPVDGCRYEGTLRIEGDALGWDDLEADLGRFRAECEADRRHEMGLRRRDFRN